MTTEIDLAARLGRQPRRGPGQQVRLRGDNPEGRDGLTVRQRETLEAIRHHYRTWGLPPTYRDLCRALGGVRIRTVAGLLEALRRKGHLHPGNGRSRNIRPVVGPGCCPCCGRPIQ